MRVILVSSIFSLEVIFIKLFSLNRDFSLTVVIFQRHSKKPINDDLTRQEENREAVVRMTEHFFEVQS